MVDRPQSLTEGQEGDGRNQAGGRLRTAPKPVPLEQHQSGKAILVLGDTSTAMAMEWGASKEGDRMQAETSVSVDRDFARFGAKTYAINKINSVEVRARHPHGTAWMFLCGLVALIGLLSFLGSADAFSFGLAVVFGPLAYMAWKRSKIIEYQLFLMTSSSEAQALTSRDADMIQSLRNRIEAAMIGQRD